METSRFPPVASAAIKPWCSPTERRHSWLAVVLEVGSPSRIFLGIGRMSYSIKEIFYTLQGEGANTGRPAVFCRFAGCNLWSGREQDRATALCRFCDTEFVGTDGPHG